MCNSPRTCEHERTMDSRFLRHNLVTGEVELYMQYSRNIRVEGDGLAYDELNILRALALESVLYVLMGCNMQLAYNKGKSNGWIYCGHILGTIFGVLRFAVSALILAVEIVALAFPPRCWHVCRPIGNVVECWACLRSPMQPNPRLAQRCGLCNSANSHCRPETDLCSNCSQCRLLGNGILVSCIECRRGGVHRLHAQASSTMRKRSGMHLDSRNGRFRLPLDTSYRDKPFPETRGDDMETNGSDDLRMETSRFEF